MTVVRFKVVKSDFSLRYSSQELRKAIDDAGRKWASDLMVMARVYPPPNGGGYIRTYNLHDSWETHKGDRGDSMWWSVEVTAIDPKGVHYTERVIGDTQYADHAATGWVKLSDYAKASEAAFIKGMDLAIKRWSK